MTPPTESPVHWFYRKKESTDDDWQPFSKFDSSRLEEVYQLYNSTDGFASSSNSCVNQKIEISKNEKIPNTTDEDGKGSVDEPIVSTNGGRYDVYINSRCRKSIYWSEPESLVLRATWFYRPSNRMSYKPFSEEAVELLENAYQESLLTSNWSQKIYLNTGDTVVFHNPKVFVHYEADHVPFTDDWSNITDNLTKPGKVWRGVQDLTFEEGENDSIDHLVFVVHGIGDICDLRARSLTEVVDDFRRLTNNLVKTHLDETETKSSGRIEFIPIYWHAALHGEKTGIDTRLNLITLNGIPKLRHFSNDTILDALFYTSPIYCQIIIDTVGNELNRVHNLFIQRNPNFKGTINLMGHSLGALIIFDILSNQKSQSTFLKSPKDDRSMNMDTENFQSVEEVLISIGLMEYLDLFKKEKIDKSALLCLDNDHLVQLGLEMGPRLKLLQFIKKHRLESLSSSHENRTSNAQAKINYPLLSFSTKCFFALGSPVAAFLTVRGVNSLSNDNFHLPVSDQMYNIFHPFDPIAYRLEPLIDENFSKISPCQIPHHKGRKRMHLELKENLIKMGSGLKEKVYNSLKPVWDSLYGLKRARNLAASTDNQGTSPTTSNLSVSESDDYQIETQVNYATESMDTDERENQNNDPTEMIDLSNENHLCYKFNPTGRVDYVLQEAPIEFFNGYIFALATHTCYWQSEDTSLFVLRNIYKNQP